MIDGWVKKVQYKQTQAHSGILSSFEKKGNPNSCNIMNEPGGHFAKWNKPDMERLMLQNVTSMCIISKNVKLKKQ